MNEEQQFKQQALSAGMAALNAEFRTQLERRDIEGYQEAVLQLLLNVDETWRAKNEKSFFDKVLDQIDNGYGAVGEKLGHDNINRYEVVRGVPFDEELPPNWDNADLDDVPVDWMPEKGQNYWIQGDGQPFVNVSHHEVLEHKSRYGHLFPTARLAQMYLDSQKPVERWRPEYGQTYWTLFDINGFRNECWLGTPQDFIRLANNNVFKTEQDARDIMNEILELLEKRCKVHNHS